MAYSPEQLANWTPDVVEFFARTLIAEEFTHLLPDPLQAIPRRPESFSRLAMTTTIMKAQTLGVPPCDYLKSKLTPTDRQTLGEIADSLASPEIETLIYQGRLTVGMVRPRADYNKWLLPDALVTRAIVAKAIVKPRLLPAFRISLPFTDEAIERFYDTGPGGPKDHQLAKLPVLYPDRFPNRWEEFKDLMKSGPVTLFLLYDEAGQAIPKWRAKVGRLFNPEPWTIRASLTKGDMHNNLVHGSDSVEAVQRELGIWIQMLRDI